MVREAEDRSPAASRFPAGFNDLNRNFKHKLISAVLAAALFFTALLAPAVSADALSDKDLRAYAAATAAKLTRSYSDPGFGWSDADWIILALARGGYTAPSSYTQTYLTNVASHLKNSGGVLSNTKSTEYSRLVLALTALGKDARDFASYDITKILGDYDATTRQGINGAVWALIALDSADYPVPSAPAGKTQASRQKYVDLILSRQLSSGGWNMSGSENGDSADPDVTAMALIALSGYTGQSKVKTAVDRGVSWLSSAQRDDGGYKSYGADNCESCAQVVIALCSLGIAPDDTRFVKNGTSVLDKLLAYRLSDGNFTHSTGSSDPMATKQALLAMTAVLRRSDGKRKLYDMSDVMSAGSGSSSGLPGKDPAVKVPAVANTDISFTDVTDPRYSAPIRELASRGVLNGVGGGLFEPKRTMYRSEFAAVVVRALGLTPKANDKFSDVPSTMWCAGYVGTANSYGIVNGYTVTTFLPKGTITHQEAAAMVARAAKLCGLDTSLSNTEIDSILRKFSDASLVSSYARGPLAFCYREGILDPGNTSIGPKTPILREEIASMVYELLKRARLI